MADVSPGGAPDQAAPPPASVSETSVTPSAPAMLPAVSAPAMLPAARSRTGWRRWLPIAGVITLLLAASIGMLLFLGVNMGPSALAIGLTAAVLPVPLLVASFLWLDRYEPEPIRYLAFCFVWGAAIATSVALVVNTSSAQLFDRIGLPDALVAVLVAPFIEELMKALGPLILFWRRRGEWSGITDGIVYCGLSALGFAMVENVLYLGQHGYASGVEQYGPASGLTNLFAIFIVRILFTGFAHPLFSAMTGIGLGIAARTGDRRVRWLAPIAGLLLAMILHGTFNLLPTLSVSLAQPFIMLYGYLGFMVPFFFAVVGFAVALRAWEGRLTERILPYYVRTGWFSPPEVAALGSLGRRHSAREWARRVAGPNGQRSMRNFQFAATQLALLRDGMQRGLNRKPADLERAALEERRLLTSMQEYRAAFTGRDPQTPPAFWNGENYQISFPDGVVRTVDAPAEPVMPVPMRYSPPPPAYAYPGVGGGYGGWAAPGSGLPAGYGQPVGYGAPGSGPLPGYGQPPVSGPPPGYGQPPVSGPPPGYGHPVSGPPPGYGQPFVYGPPVSGPPPGYGQPPIAGPPPGYGPPVFSPPPSYGPPLPSSLPGHGQPPVSGPPPAYGPPVFGPPPTYGQPAYGSPPGYGQPVYGPPPGYGTPANGQPPAFGPPVSGPPPFAPIPSADHGEAPSPDPRPEAEDPPAR